MDSNLSTLAQRIKIGKTFILMCVFLQFWSMILTLKIPVKFFVNILNFESDFWSMASLLSLSFYYKWLRANPFITTQWPKLPKKQSVGLYFLQYGTVF